MVRHSIVVEALTAIKLRQVLPVNAPVYPNIHSNPPTQRFQNASKLYYYHPFSFKTNIHHRSP